jgi:Kef-type K+ transport system membrane component KefB
MNKILIPIILLAIFVAFYEQRSEKPNVIITVIAVAIFMFGLMKLSSKIKSNSKEEDDE